MDGLRSGRASDQQRHGASASWRAMESLSALLPSLRHLSSGPAPKFEEHARLCAQVAIGRCSDADASAAAAASGTPVESLRALVVLFLEAARAGMAAGEIQAALTAVLPEERARSIAAIATEGQPTVRAALEALSLGPAELVDVRWHRATIAAAGREVPRAGGTPLYTITLTVRDADGSTRPLLFSANVEELTDLVRCPAPRATACRTAHTRRALAMCLAGSSRVRCGLSSERADERAQWAASERTSPTPGPRTPRAHSATQAAAARKSIQFPFGSPVHYHTSPSHAYFTLGFGSSLGVGLEGLTSGTVAS